MHEGRAALDGGTDGLDVLRRVSAEAMQWLAPGGHVLVEISEGQSPTAAHVLAHDGLKPRTVVSLDGTATVVVGTRRKLLDRAQDAGR